MSSGCRAHSSCRCAAATAAGTERYACLVALGAVIRGDTPHFEYVAGEAARGAQRSGDRGTALPVGFGVLTVDTMQQAVDRAGGTAGTRERGGGGSAAGGGRDRPASSHRMLRTETKSRARALAAALRVGDARRADGRDGCLRPVSRSTGPEPRVLDRAEALARAVVEIVDDLDAELARASENWRLSRIAVVERNILRLGHLELRRGDVPPKVAIDEAVRLAQWFGGARAPGFVNGVLDGIAHALGRL